MNIVEQFKTLPADVTVMILATLPTVSVLSLCQINTEFKEFCEKYSDKLFSKLSRRDFGHYLMQKQEDNWKVFYLEKLTTLGQPYGIDIIGDKNFCKTEIGNVAKILPEGYWENTNNMLRFYIGPYIFDDSEERQVLVKDYDKGTRYWIMIILNNLGKRYAYISKNYTKVFDRALIYFNIIQNNNLQMVFFEDWKDINIAEFPRSLRKIFEKKGSICYSPKQGLINKIFIKEIVLD